MMLLRLSSIDPCQICIDEFSRHNTVSVLTVALHAQPALLREFRRKVCRIAIMNLINTPSPSNASANRAFSLMMRTMIDDTGRCLMKAYAILHRIRPTRAGNNAYLLPGGQSCVRHRLTASLTEGRLDAMLCLVYMNTSFNLVGCESLLTPWHQHGKSMYII